MSTDTPGMDQDGRTCTCHPFDNPPIPCPRKFALSACRIAALEHELAAAQAVIIQLRMGTCGLCNWKEREDCSGARHSMSIELAAVKAECDALRVDAERYRWLRNADGGPPYVHAGDDDWSLILDGDELDAAIDAATREAE